MQPDCQSTIKPAQPTLLTLKYHRTQINNLTTLIHNAFKDTDEAHLVTILISQTHIESLCSLRSYLDQFFEGGTAESLGVRWDRTVFAAHILTILDFLISRFTAFQRYLLQTPGCESVNDILALDYDDFLIEDEMDVGGPLVPSASEGIEIFLRESLQLMWSALQGLWNVFDEIVVRYRGDMEARVRTKISL